MFVIYFAILSIASCNDNKFIQLVRNLKLHKKNLLNKGYAEHIKDGFKIITSGIQASLFNLIRF